MKTRSIRSFACLSFLLVSACATASWQENQKAIIGGVGGATAGGLIASAIDHHPAVIIGGAIVGGLVGSAIGDRMDAADRKEARFAQQRALETAPSGSIVPWRNPDSGHSGTITPTRTYQAEDRSYCREFQQVVSVDGKNQQAHGTACREDDGTWRILQGG